VGFETVLRSACGREPSGVGRGVSSTKESDDAGVSISDICREDFFRGKGGVSFTKLTSETKTEA